MSLKNKPDFIVAGFPKCGTTWLYDRLSELPDFEMPNGKELHFFSRHKRYNTDGKLGNTKNFFLLRKVLLRNFGINGFSFFLNYCNFFCSNEKLYLKLFKHTSSFTGDITPTYGLLPPSSVVRLKKLLPDVKIIFIIRNPIDRAWSHYRMYLRNNKKDFEKLSEEEIFWFFKRPLMEEYGKYSIAIEKYQKEFPKSNISVNSFDSLTDTPDVFLKEIVSFIGGDESGVDLHCKIDRISNASKKINIPENVKSYLLSFYHDELIWLKNNYPKIYMKWDL